MKTIHRVTFTKEDNVDDQLARLEIKYEKTPIFKRYILTFEIDEADLRWPHVKAMIQEKDAVDLYDTFFTDEEVLNAEWLRLIVTFEHGYPQPENAWLRYRPNYTDWCPSCGTFRQTASFTISKEPNLRKNDFMRLYWANAPFCTPRVFDELESHDIKGYEMWDVMLSKSQQPSTRVSQLFVPQTAGPGLVDRLVNSRCDTCGIVKHVVHQRGIMHLRRDALRPGVDLMQTYEWFGHGHRAFREIVVSNRLARLIVEKGWRGVRLKVVEAI